MKTPLYDRHVNLRAKIVDFAGWQMPIQYQGILAEHQAVRHHVGLFDVSHMGRISISGLIAERFLDELSTNLLAGKKDGTATYTLWCNEEGTCVDDLIVYKENPTSFFFIVNASNREKDLAHLLRYSANRDLIITKHFHDEGILALQGPKALSLLELLFPNVKALKPMHFYQEQWQQQPLIISRTGYTGEDGFEICAKNDLIVTLWDLLLEKGKPFQIQPIGLGARDMLRLEMGYALYGHELTESIAANETVSKWTIRWEKPYFIGKTALERLENSPSKRYEYGILLQEPGVLREGYPVYLENEKIGIVTSGAFSPTLNCSIGIVLLEKNLPFDHSVGVQIRQRICSAKISHLPFLPKR